MAWPLIHNLICFIVNDLHLAVLQSLLRHMDSHPFVAFRLYGNNDHPQPQFPIHVLDLNIVLPAALIKISGRTWQILHKLYKTPLLNAYSPIAFFHIAPQLLTIYSNINIHALALDILTIHIEQICIAWL